MCVVWLTLETQHFSSYGECPMKNTEMRIGIDLGGTKIEALAIDNQGVELARHRVDTPRDDYDATIMAMVGLVRRLEAETGDTGTVGAGIPGCISGITGLVKNANSTWLNGRPTQYGYTQCSARSWQVRIANDANCFALSEATDGAAAEQACGLWRDSGDWMRRWGCRWRAGP